MIITLFGGSHEGLENRFQHKKVDGERDRIPSSSDLVRTNLYMMGRFWASSLLVALAHDVVVDSPIRASMVEPKAECDSRVEARQTVNMKSFFMVGSRAIVSLIADCEF